MAKSLRSKWRRKCKAVKRARYGKKELEQLKKTVLNDPAYKEPNNVEMEDGSTSAPSKTTSALSKIVTIVDKNKMTRTDNETMETNARKYNPRTMKDQNGTYPVWMNQRRIHEKKNLLRASEKKKRKLTKKGKR